MEDLKYQIDLLTALNERLLVSEKMYRHICECTGNLFVYFNLQAKPAKVDLIGPWDEKFDERIVGHPYDESYVLNLLAEDKQDEFRVKLLELEKTGAEYDSLEVMSSDKKYFFFCEAKCRYDSAGNPLEKIIVLTDITRNKSNAEELEYLAYYDSITGVYNRNYFISKLRNMIENASKEKTSVEVIFIDIDDFKKINDDIGLVYGDELVQEFGQYLKSYNSEDVMVGRFGSDVFVAAIYNPCGSRSADNIYRGVQERLRKPFYLSNKAELKFTVTCGVAEYPDAGITALELLKNGEIVLYRAKENGKNCIKYFEPEVLDRYTYNAELEDKLANSVKNEELTLYYQPLYEAKTGKLRGCEALLRWLKKDGEGDICEPSEFIPIAEKNGCIVELGEYVIRQSLKSMAEWRTKFHIPLIFSINVSAVELEKDSYVEDIQQLVSIYNINPAMIELEISEAAIINNKDVIIDRIKTLRGVGFRIAVDNFGREYSSVMNLCNLSIDTLKIDRLITSSVVNNKASSIICESIINLAQTLGFEAVAEGVETKEEFNYFRNNKIDTLQGFLLGKPLPKSEFEKILIRQMP